MRNNYAFNYWPWSCLQNRHTSLPNVVRVCSVFQSAHMRCSQPAADAEPKRMKLQQVCVWYKALPFCQHFSVPPWNVQWPFTRTSWVQHDGTILGSNASDDGFVIATPTLGIPLMTSLHWIYMCGSCRSWSVSVQRFKDAILRRRRQHSEAVEVQRKMSLVSYSSCYVEDCDDPMVE